MFSSFWWRIGLAFVFALPLLAQCWNNQGTPFPADAVNLALRRTAHGLLRRAGDYTSRIPAVQQVDLHTWRLSFTQPFDYAELPALLEASLVQYGVQQPYQVAIRRCDDAMLLLGYHQLDVLSNADSVPCSGRVPPEGCQYLEITFAATDSNGFASIRYGNWLLVLSALGIGIWVGRRIRSKAVFRSSTPSSTAEGLTFGQSCLDVSQQRLVCNGLTHALTFREAKVLRLFAERPNQLLERAFLLEHGWADEGVLVGRSVDMFVSRLRKKLANDPTVALVAVHGVGYRLEVK